MEKENRPKEKPASIVLEVQSVRHTANLTIKPKQVKENESNG